MWTCGDEEFVLNKAVDDLIGYQEEPVDGQLMKFLVGWLIVYWHHSENYQWLRLSLGNSLEADTPSITHENNADLYKTAR